MRYIMKRSFFIIIVVASLIFLTACPDDPNSPSTPVEILPLALGNYWIMESLKLDSVGSVLRTTYDTLEINDEMTYQGKQYFMLTNVGVRNGSDGMYQLIHDTENDTYQEVLTLKYPAKAGDVFMSGSDEITVMATNISITVPAGTFKCYQYRDVYEVIDDENPEYSGKYIRDMFVAPGIGFVKMEGIATTLQGAFKHHSKNHLKSYKLMK